ncbi:MAG TPA: hypothetical protein VH351_18110 [Bryobacteraceae bacterium]|jgi:hypothetical protein|nr:hypothetical protein [Bryobacteraceae bacterium]
MRPRAPKPCSVYLEAATKSQDFLTTKWVLRSCGHTIKSTWHEDSTLAFSGSQTHWSRARLEEMKSCDTLVVVRERDEQLPPELALFVGFALARNLRVIWVGLPINTLEHFASVRFFDTPDEFRHQLSRESDPRHAHDLLAA